MNKTILLLTILFLLMAFACTTKVKPVVKDPILSIPAALKQWQINRIQAITGPDGWMSLAGLYWLKEGENAFGSSSANQVVFPENAPSNIGTFELKDGRVRMRIEKDIWVKEDTAMPKDIELVPDMDGHPTTLQLGSLSWYLIQRENRFGIRLKDSQNPRIQTFKGIDHFLFSEKWKIPAQLKPATKQSTITLRNVIDMDVTMKLEGYLQFEINNVAYQLEALDGGTDSYFIIFADETTGMETYGGGRYLYVPRVDATNKTVIDFNKAHNPPCAFTDFATCPLPSAANRLELSILAGEKEYH